mmetsp:Transcript_15170/g.17527  ORF Transcript_15170/g.17527 Transcript_15170/m.17527 type:complete len:214 (-) Transcript_15170:885-1526(-)
MRLLSKKSVTSGRTMSSTLMRKSASSLLKHNGGLIRRTLLWAPPFPTKRPSSRHCSIARAVSDFAGSLVLRFRTNSIPMNSPTPRTSPMMWCRSLSSISLGIKYCETSSAFCCSSSRSMISNTASPAAQATGLPPLVLKYCTPSNDRAISRVVNTAPRGNPLPMGFPSVKMSGTTPCASNAQKWDPVRPNPVWTSSQIVTPPSRRTDSYTCDR